MTGVLECLPVISGKSLFVKNTQWLIHHMLQNCTIHTVDLCKKIKQLVIRFNTHLTHIVNYKVMRIVR